MGRRVISPKIPVHPALDAVAQAERRVVRRELARRRRLPDAVAALNATLFQPQRRFVESTAPRIVTCSGRRSGKSEGIVARALRAAAAHPGSWVPIIERTTTCQSAQLIWRRLQDIDERHALGCNFHGTQMVATLGNRARIQVVGADTIEAADKIRGEHPPEALLDEAGTFRPHVLEYLLREVLEPALMDYQGTLVLAGTPAVRKVGPFAQACGVLDGSPTTWERHHWTFRDNDALPLKHPGDAAARRAAREAWFQELLTRYGWTEESPWVQREYLGQWCEDATGLVYRLQPFNHVGIGHPDTTEGRWYYGLGIDFGYDDPTAFVVVAWRRGEPTLWVLESYEQAGLIPSAVAAHVERLRSRYRFEFIVGDTGGYGKGPAVEMQERYGIPLVGAKKRGKEAHVAFVNGDLVSGVIRIVDRGNADLVADLYALRRAEGESWEEDARDANHLPDAFLYATMQQRASLGGLGLREGPQPGSDAWERARMEALADALVASDRGEAAGDALAEAVDDLPQA